MESPLMHLALVGTPNSGKTSLFNALTGSRQKVANYPGVTVERKEGAFVTPLGPPGLGGRPARHLFAARPQPRRGDHPRCRARTGQGEAPPDLVLCVADATNLRLTIRLLLELKNIGRPLVLVLNMFDIATRRGVTIDVPKLSEALGVPVVTSIAVRKGGTADLLRLTDELPSRPSPAEHQSTLAAADRAGAARHPARGRPHHRGHRQPAGAARHLDRADRRGGAAPGRRPRGPAADPVRDVPGGVRLGAAADGPAVRRLRRARPIRS